MKPTRLNVLGLLGGIVAGFLLAVLLGYQASTYSKPAQFTRFTGFTDAQGIFFPPFRMLEHLALARWQPGKTIVIVAGNSIFNGVSQQQSEIWTQRLQELLGPEKYVVINLSFSGANPTGPGMVVAEALVRRGLPVLVVANAGTWQPLPSSAGPYAYCYWDARAQGALMPYPLRDQFIAGWEAQQTPATREKAPELRLAAALNSRLYFMELWQHVGLHDVFTVWNFLARDEFWRARDAWPDPELRALPVEQRFRLRPELEMNIVRDFSSTQSVRDAAGNWQLTPEFNAVFHKHVEGSFPPALRPHMLMVLCQNAPHYRNRLTADEQARDQAVWEKAAALWREIGISCVISGKNFEDADYNDRTHLTPLGGHKLAALVADEIRKLPAPAATP